MRKLSVLLTCIVCGWLVSYDVSGQDPYAGVIFFQHRQFNIPFKNDSRNVNTKEVRLYVSTDQGRSWQLTATAAPDGKDFRFNTGQDGFYSFTVQTVDATGKAYPASTDEFRPVLKVVVDTVPPSVQVQPLPARNGEVGVTWVVRDDNLETALPDAVQLQYRLAGSVTWQPLFIPPGAQQHYWNPRTNAELEVRVLARDRAGNTGENKTTVRLVGNVNPGLQNAHAGPTGDPLNIERKYVNTSQVTLGYELQGEGPSGVSSVELWYMYWNSKTWNKLQEYDLRNADPQQPKKLTFRVDEGVYGISLVAKSGVGLSERPPQVGDRPQFWIEVDLTRPTVELQGVVVGNGIEKGKLTVNWSARDKNLGPTPIRLSYAESDKGDWKTFAEGLANQGRYVWTMPEMLPFQFYVRVEATDLAGNVGEAVTPDKIKVDLALPKAKIINIEPASR